MSYILLRAPIEQHHSGPDSSNLEFGPPRSHVVLETYHRPLCWKSEERHIHGESQTVPHMAEDLEFPKG